MSEPMRFSLKHHGQLSCVEHCSEGDYVLYSDYARLKADVARLRKAVMHSPAAQLKLKELEGKTTYEEINPKEGKQP